MATTFNEAELLDRVDNDTAFLAETVGMLSTDGRTLMAQLQHAAAGADAPAVFRSAHALKGMISNFCSPKAQESALEVERIGKSGDLAAAPAAIERLEKDLEALITELERFVEARA